MDGTNAASSNNMTITPDGSDLMNSLTSYVINFDAGEITLWARPGGLGGCS